MVHLGPWLWHGDGVTREINFDGLIGPTHNYAGLSFGNLAATSNAGAIARPRAAALQGLGKMRRLIGLGLTQGFLPPHDRPAIAFLRTIGFVGDDDAVCAAAFCADPVLFANAFSASAMWTANAATVSPAADTVDRRCHLSVANLTTNLHRSIEQDETLRLLTLAFGGERHFAVHPALPARLGDEGAANHMRLTPSHGERGVEVFVYGVVQAGGFPARQSRSASEAIARRHGLDPAMTLFVQQSDAAIQAGAFHNDVVAVANETILFTHEQAFEDRDTFYAALGSRVPGLAIVEAPADRISLADAVSSYLFNSQLVTLPEGGMALITPGEVRDNPRVWSWLSDLVGGNGPIAQVEVIDVRESMRNGGGPACLRLRVAVDDAAFAAIDPRFLLDEARCDLIERIVEMQWPDQIALSDLGSPDLWAQCRIARSALLEGLGLDELL
ncbi:N-succinylarginine dihydrolase [soil metagenome]